MSCRQANAARMPPDERVLMEYSDEALMNELSRRIADRRNDERTTHVWCDRCVHFEIWDKPGRAHLAMPNDYNPCTKRHRMRFQTPDEIGDDYGFYRIGCRDRHVVDEGENG